MKLSVSAAALLALAASCNAFTATGSVRPASTALSMSKEGSTRAEFLQQSLAAAAGLAFLPSPASAAKYGSFGAGSPEVLDPKTAEVDKEILGSEAVQKALEGVKGYLSAVKSMQSTLSSDGQADIGPTIRKSLDFVQLRSDLNTVNTAFDEDTQRGTDRLIRVIMQDVTELETANRQKAGVARSEIRLNTMKGKLDKLSKAFEDYLAFV